MNRQYPVHCGLLSGVSSVRLFDLYCKYTTSSMICHYTCGIKLKNLSGFVFGRDNPFQGLILLDLYNVSHVVTVYLLLSCFISFQSGFGVKIGVKPGYGKAPYTAGIPCSLSG